MKKVCRKCLQELDLEQFSRDSKARDGRKPRCRACLAVAAQERSQKPGYKAKRAKWAKVARQRGGRALQDRTNERKRRLYAANLEESRVKGRERQRAVYHADLEKSRRKVREQQARRWLSLDEVERERIRQASRDWWAANRDRAMRANKDWVAENRIVVRAIQHRYRARKRFADWGDVTALNLSRLLELVGEECVYCGGPFESLDHFVPLRLGGVHAIENLVPCCIRCNTSKKASHPERWMQRLGFAQ